MHDLTKAQQFNSIAVVLHSRESSLPLRKRPLEKFRAFIDSFSPISDATWEAVRPLFQPEKLAKGHLFIDSGKVAHRLAFLESGYLRGYYRNEEAQEYNKHFFVPPSFVGGYASLITGRPNRIIHEALTDCQIWVAEYSEFTALYDAHHDLERAARRLAEMFFVQKEEREVQIVLLEAKERYEIFQRDFSALEQHIPQYHIAAYLGITPTQLSRIRRKRSEE